MDALTQRPEEAHNRSPIPFGEFVTLMAAVMALLSLGIDSMLPALPTIAGDLGVTNANHQQFVIGSFVMGLGVGQLLHGPLSDRFGRRPVLLVAMLIYVATNIACAAAGSFTLLLVARVAGGLAMAAARVVTVALVRDCFSGRAMARVMSTTFIVFMIVPVLAPAYGQVVLLFGDWRMIFGTVAGATLLVALWFGLRMPETQHRDDRLPLSPARVVAGWRATLGDRLSVGYMLAAAAMQGGMYGYLNSIEQVVGQGFGRPKALVFVFAGTGCLMAVSNFLNARLVMRLGTRFLGHLSVSVLIALSLLHLLLIHLGVETLIVFAILQALTMGCFGLSASNFSSLAMQNMGHIAGTAASVQGFVQVSTGALLGALVGQAFDGTPRPMIAGLALAGAGALAFAAMAEQGRLFRPAAAA